MGKPIDVYTGRHYYDEFDIGYPSPSSLVIRRHFLSGYTETGPFGMGTSMNFERSLVNTPDGGMIYTDADGQMSKFTPSASTTSTDAEGNVTVSLGMENILYLNDAHIVLAPQGFPSEYKVMQYGSGARYIFNADGRLVEQYDSYGNLTTVGRDASGAIVNVADSFDRTLSFVTNAVASGAGYIINSVTDDLGRSVHYSYDDQDRMTAVAWLDATGTEVRTVGYEYPDKQTFVHTDSLGAEVERNTFNQNMRALTQAEDDTGGFSLAYDSGVLAGQAGKTSMTLDELNLKRTYSFDSTGTINEITDMALDTGKSYSRTYSREPLTNRLVSEADELGQETSYAYTVDDGLLETVTDAADNITTMAYGGLPSLKKPTHITDALGRVTSLSYNVLGKVEFITAPGYSGHIGIAYTTRGQVEKITGLDGNFLTFAYDDNGMTTGVSHSVKGTLATYTYDTAGRMKTATDAREDTVSYDYDEAAGTVTVTDPAGKTTTTAYDDNGNLLSLTDARGNTVSYTYGEGDNASTMSDQLNNAESYDFKNGTSLLTSVTDRDGKKVAFSYADAGRYVRTDYLSDNEYDEVVLDEAGRMKSARSSVTGELSFTYTDPAADGVVNMVKSVTSSEGTVTYGYDRLSRRTSMSYGALSVGYVYNAKGLTNTITYTNPVTSAQESFNFTYDTAGRMTGMSYPNGVAGTLGYSGSGDLTGISYTKGATPVDSVGYGYDSVGFINSVNRAGAELLIPSISNATHDAANRMTEFNGKPLTYDKSGNVLDMGVQLNVWNQKGQLIHVTGARGGTVSYKYDALGRRVEKDVGGVITRYVYDGINLIAETDAAGTEKAWYVHGGLDRPLVRIAADGSVSYYHADILGSTIALTDAGGTVTTTYRYSPFGETVVEGTDIAQPFRFTGREWDAETGLYYYRARYYSPDMKRFITEDPIRFAAGDVNFYAYVGNNPGNYIDPFGLYGKDVHYDLTFELAVEAGFNYNQAARIAEGNYSTDFGFIFGKGPFTINVLKNHFASRDKAHYYIARAFMDCDVDALGTALHRYQDTYSHKGYTPRTHAEVGKLPDVFYDPREFSSGSKRNSVGAVEAASRMLEGTRNIIINFAKECGCQ